MNADGKTKEERRIEFMLMEHACLQDRIRHASQDLYLTETIIPLAIALMYAWFYSDAAAAGRIPKWTLGFPVFLVLYGALRQRLRYRALWGHHEYLRRIEREFYGPVARKEDCRPYGMETHWAHKAILPIGPERYRITRHAWMRILFWIVLLGATGFLAYQNIY